MSSCWDIPSPEKVKVKRGYGHLPKDVISEWATYEADLSTQFMNGEIEGVSATEDGQKRKARIMNLLDEKFNTRASRSLREQYDASLRQMFLDRLEDPGLLHNFEYFDVPSSEFMIMFYVSTWTGRMADTMIYLHNYGWDLKGNFATVPEDDVWYQMSHYEAMNINERIKAQSVVDMINEIVVSSPEREFQVTAFGGGNLPERLYGAYNDDALMWVGLPLEAGMDFDVVKINIFDDGVVRPLKELYADDVSGIVTYYKENLLMAIKHNELARTQSLVWMHGVSMYLGQLMPAALMSGFALLKPGGVMTYDYLLMTESMRRVLATQGWPKGRGEMSIYDTPQEAIERARADIAEVNKQLNETEFFDIEDIKTTLVEPWGPTSVRVVARKFSS